MSDLKLDDQRKRQKLIKMFTQLEYILDENKDDGTLHKHLEDELFTRNYKERLAEFKETLKQEECPVLVVGK